MPPPPDIPSKFLQNYCKQSNTFTEKQSTAFPLCIIQNLGRYGYSQAANKKVNGKLITAFIPCSLPISESSDSLSPEVVIPTAPATELEAKEIKQRLMQVTVPLKPQNSHQFHHQGKRPPSEERSALNIATIILLYDCHFKQTSLQV